MMHGTTNIKFLLGKYRIITYLQRGYNHLVTTSYKPTAILLKSTKIMYSKQSLE